MPAANCRSRSAPEANTRARETHDRELRENALVNQKNKVLDLIHGANEPEDLEKAQALIDFAAELWEADGYGYKLREVRKLLRDRAERLLRAEEHYLSGLRKNDRTRRQTESDIAKLRRLSEWKYSS